MEKQGFKYTEVGLIPQDWNVNILNDLIDLLTDYDANGSFSSVAENVKVFDYEKYAWYVRSTDLENNSSMNEVKYVDESSYKFLKKTALYGNELLFLKRGDIGNIYLFKMQTKFATVAPNLYLLKLNNKSSSSYLYYYFKSKHGQSQLKSKNASSTLGALYKDDVKSIYVPLPPTLEEQKAIATALSDVDELITNLDKLINKKKAIKQGAMQQLLTPPHKGGKRIDGFSGDWVEKTLGELFDFKTTSTKKQFFDLSGNLIVMDMGSVSIDGKILRSKKASCDFDILKKGDLVMPKDDIGGGNIIGKVAYIDKDNSYVLSDHVFRLNSINDKINSLYFYYLINSRIVNESILKVVSGSAQLGLGLNTIKKITVCYNSDKSQQIAIAQILSDMDLEIEQLESKKSKYQSIKQGMMQELLTGKTRLI